MSDDHGEKSMHRLGKTAQKSKADPSLSTEKMAQLSAILEEPLPERLAALVEKLRAKENSNEQMTQAKSGSIDTKNPSRRTPK